MTNQPTIAAVVAGNQCFHMLARMGAERTRAIPCLLVAIPLVGLVATSTMASDNCDTSLGLAGPSIVELDLTDATTDGPAHAACAFFGQAQIERDVWFVWTSECTGEVVIETCGLSAVDTKIVVYDAIACPPTDAALVDCNDDACGLQSRVTFSAEQGQSYLVRVGTPPGADGGAVSMSIACEAGDLGADSCAGATPISGVGAFAFDNANANQDGPSHSECGAFGADQIDRDVWFCWTSGVRAERTLSTCDTADMDTRVAVYEGCDCPASDESLITCDDDGCGLQSTASWKAEAGREYLIRIGTHPGAAGGMGVLDITAGPVIFENEFAAGENARGFPSHRIAAEDVQVLTADEFILTGSDTGWTVTEVDWAGVFAQSLGVWTSAVGVAQTFDLLIFADDGTGTAPVGDPGDPLPGLALVHRQIEVIGQPVTSFMSGAMFAPEFALYHADIEPAWLAADTRYWLVVMANEPVAGRGWWWATGAVGNAVLGGGTGPSQNGWLSTVVQTAFAIRGQELACDASGRIERTHVVAMAECIVGPGTDAFPGCRCSDLNEDGHVDLIDVAELQRNFRGF